MHKHREDGPLAGEELFHVVPQARADFQQALEERLVLHLSADATPATKVRRVYPWRQLRLAAATVTVTVLVVTLLTAIPLLAHELIQYFQREETDVMTGQTTVPVDEFSLYRQFVPTEPDTPLTLAEAQGAVAYDIYIPRIEGLYLSHVSVDGTAVTLTYVLPEDRSPNGDVVLEFTQSPLIDYDPPNIGASASVEDVMLGDLVGAYVRGNFVARSTDWQFLSTDASDIQDTTNSPQMILVDYESVWVNDPLWQQLVWNEDNMVYSLYSRWANGILDIRAIAESIVDDEAVNLAEIIGLPRGLPPEYANWLENITFYDERGVVVYEYRGVDWFVFIAEGNPSDIVFDRPEATDIQRQTVRVDDALGEYVEGMWQVTFPTLGSIRPYREVQVGAVEAEIVPFQWLRWRDGALQREITVVNGCHSQELQRPCYGRDELVELAAGITFSEPNYARRQTFNAPVRANLRPSMIIHHQTTLEGTTGFHIRVPRSAKYVPWPYQYTTLGFDTSLRSVWQLYSQFETMINSYSPIPSEVEPPVILVFQQPLSDEDRPLIRGCDIPDGAEYESVQVGSLPGQYTSGTWGDSVQPFYDHERFCLPDQDFQVLSWSDSQMRYAILAIDASELRLERLVDLARALD